MQQPPARTVMISRKFLWELNQGRELVEAESLIRPPQLWQPVVARKYCSPSLPFPSVPSAWCRRTLQTSSPQMISGLNTTESYISEGGLLQLALRPDFYAFQKLTDIV